MICMMNYKISNYVIFNNDENGISEKIYKNFNFRNVMKDYKKLDIKVR